MMPLKSAAHFFCRFMEGDIVQRDQTGIDTVGCHQAIVIAVLVDMAVAHDQNPPRIPCRRDAVRDGDAGSAGHNGREL